MNFSGSEWSSGCESGWTVYLDESYPYPTNNINTITDHHNHPIYHKSNSTSRNECCESEEEKDLSMVSDASSGPPHFPQDDNEHIFSTFKKIVKDKASKKAIKEQKKQGKYQQQQYFYDNNIAINNLDDTASSPAITYSNKGNSAFNTQRDCWQFSHPTRADFAEPSQLRGRRF